MTLFEKDIQKQTSKITLSASERHDLRARLHAYVEYHPLPISLQKHALVSLPSFFSSLTARAGAVSMATILALTIIPFIAEKSDPGDTLYAIKSGFNERVREQLITTPYEKITFETERLERRMAEVRLLVEEGKLDDATEQKLTESIITHSENIQHSIDEISTTDKEGAELAQIELAATVTANEAAVVAVDDAKASDGSSDKKQITSLKNAVAGIRETTESKTATSTAKSPERVIALVEAEITRATELRDSVAGSLSDIEKADVEKLFESLHKKIATLSYSEQDMPEVATTTTTIREPAITTGTSSTGVVSVALATTTELVVVVAVVEQKPTPTQVLSEIKKLILFLNNISLRMKIDIAPTITPVKENLQSPDKTATTTVPATVTPTKATPETAAPTSN